MGNYYNDKLKANIRLWYLYHILENLVLMYLISFVHRCPVNKCLCLLEDISLKILPSTWREIRCKGTRLLRGQEGMF